MNLVVGATGLLGSEICRLLASEGKPARALVRSSSEPNKVAGLKNLDIEIVTGDLKNRLSLEDACRGVNAVISTASSIISRHEGDSIKTVDLEGQINLVDAAKSANVEQFIFISFPPAGVDFPLQTAKRTVENHLKNSGLNYTILQPTNFMEVWLSPALGFDAANTTARIYGSGENKISWISYKDVAKFAVASISTPDTRNAVIELGGPEALSPLEVVRIFEEAKNQKFEIQHIPEEVLRQQKEAANDSLQESFAALMLSYSQGSIVEMKETLKTFPLQLTSVRDFAELNKNTPE